ncbi:hypothetical protein V495_01163 [Pseudogymnoascus sp. VKM F-4514 (FW-929)]|nr:hypothetical protein V495_01163 [Pseudogymnoascus sp. VKM F-4514 (FW-929)]KFY67182.1 hypothetical protein V497_00522 [Pseudogymnoascus sp. VKM F-4516 (FW-969)]
MIVNRAKTVIRMAGHHRTRSHRWSPLVAVDGFSPGSTTGPPLQYKKLATDGKRKRKETETRVNDRSQSTVILVPYSCPRLCSFLETSTTQKPTRGTYDFDLSLLLSHPRLVSIEPSRVLLAPTQPAPPR